MDLGSNVLQQVRERGPPVAMEMTKPDQYSRLRPLNCNPSPKFPSLPPIFGIILPHLSIYPSIYPSIYLFECLTFVVSPHSIIHMQSPTQSSRPSVKKMDHSLFHLLLFIYSLSSKYIFARPSPLNKDEPSTHMEIFPKNNVVG